MVRGSDWSQAHGSKRKRGLKPFGDAIEGLEMKIGRRAGLGEMGIASHFVTAGICFCGYFTLEGVLYLQVLCLGIVGGKEHEVTWHLGVVIANFLDFMLQVQLRSRWMDDAFHFEGS